MSNVRTAACHQHAGFTRLRHAWGHSIRSQKQSFLRISSQVVEPMPLPNVKPGAQKAKEALLQLISITARGGDASRADRGSIEEAQVDLEAFGGDVDYERLPGLWRLIYTTAPDVAPLLRVPRSGLVPLQVGNIYQRFSTVRQGIVENIIQLSIPFLLEQGDGVTIKVRATYEVKSPRRIQLVFQEAGAGELRISPLLETLIAPAILPRNWLQQRLLLALKEFKVRVPLRNALPAPLADVNQRVTRSAGSEYLLTYLDDDMLVGRQTGPGGTFIFLRDTTENRP